MNTKAHKGTSQVLSLAEAVDVLSNLAEMDEYQAKTLMTEAGRLPQRNVRWLEIVGKEGVLHAAKETFKSVLHYLKSIYTQQANVLESEKSTDRVRTIMVLVGAAAKQLDKYTHLFLDTQYKSISEIKEYRQLQHFYRTKLAPRLDENKLGRWILALSQQALARKSALMLDSRLEQMTSKHVFVDLDSIKKDTEYELLFLRKEDGTRFFNPRLIRNLKRVNDFGSYFSSIPQSDPLLGMEQWLDSFVQKTASEMVAHLKSRLDAFFREAMRHKGNILVEGINKALLALLLSASSKHLHAKTTSKNCLAYFTDFQVFLRQVLDSKEYQKMMAYPPRGGNNRLAICIFDTVLAVCRGLYLYGHGLQIMQPFVQQLMNEGVVQEALVLSEATPVTDKLARDYAYLQQKLKPYIYGPVTQVLDSILDGSVCRNFWSFY